MGDIQSILVTGNGFDLYHGLKTNYMDFIRCVEDAFAMKKEERGEFEQRLTELCNVNGFFRHFHFTPLDIPSWSNFEREMEIIMMAMVHFLDVVKENEKDIDFDLVSFNIYGGIFSYRDLQVFKHFARIFEQIYDDPAGGMFKLRQQYISLEKVLDKKAVVDEVRRELDSFTGALDLYLTHCVNTKDISKRSVQVQAASPDYVINFNYTDTALLYGVPEKNIFYAKGKAGRTPVSLVLGIPDESEEHMDWIYLKNYFQRLMKFIGIPDKNQLYPINEEGFPVPVITYYFGYDFPQGDEELIRELASCSQKMVVYYLDREDYANKIIRLLHILGKNKVTERVYEKTIVFEELR